MIGLMTMLKSASIYFTQNLKRKCRLDYLATGFAHTCSFQMG